MYNKHLITNFLDKCHVKIGARIPLASPSGRPAPLTTRATAPGQASQQTSASTSQFVEAPAERLELSTANINETLQNQTRHRGLPAYVKAMPGLDAALLELSNRPNAHWLDVGAGIGNAPLGFKKYGANAFETPRYENGRTNEPAPNPQNVSLTLLDLDIAPVAEPGVQTLSGRFIENISSEELPKADVVTAESQADLAHELNTAPTGTFLDLFRAGPVSNPLARALNRTRRWAHVGPISPVAIEDVRAGKVTATTRFGSVGEVLSSLRRLGRRSFEFDAVTSADEVTSTPDLITDSGVFASSTRPTEVLRKYFEAVGDEEFC